MERHSFGSSTGLTTAASVHGELEQEFEQNEQRCYPNNGNHIDADPSYANYDDSFAPSHRRDDRDRDVSEYSPDEGESGYDDEDDDEEDGCTEVSGSQYEHDHDQSASALRDDSRYAGIDDSQMTSTTGFGDDVSGLSESVLSRP
ncbi:hypothetical protein KEM54_003324 [Ascosphaera aggregata]|nr:hypothetical protein KEM54_003324 [Ascosphaera aggregata]